MDAHVRQAIARMVDWCQKQPQAAEFLARGFVIDTVEGWGENDDSTMLRIAQQIREYFPASIDVSPVIDDMAFVAVAQAKISGQRFQELELTYVSDGIIPATAKANTQSYVKWYSAENVLGSDAQGLGKTLKPGWGGGAGGDGASLAKQLGLATKKGFLLQVRALDITDAKSKTLLANMDVVQAFGGSPEALKEAIEIIAKGGPEAAALKAVITQIVEIKTLRAALTAAGDTPGAGPLAAALAIKTEALSAQLATMKTPGAIKASITQTVEIVKIDLQARQIEIAVNTLGSNILRPSAAHLAATESPRVVMTAQIARAVQALQATARNQGVPVRDIIATTLARTAPAELAAPVRAMTELLSKADFFPVIEQSISPRAALTVRETLTTPVLQAVAETPVRLSPVITNLQITAGKADMPPMIAQMIKESGLKTMQADAIAPSLRAPMLQSVSENLKAITMTSALPDSVKPAVVIAAAQMEAVTIQARQPAPEALPTTPQPVREQSPLDAVTKATDVPAPREIPAASPEVADAKAAQSKIHKPAENDNSFSDKAPVNDQQKMKMDTPVQKADVSFKTGEEQKKVDKPEAKKEEPGCGGKICKTCFNKTCQALSAEKVAAITSDVQTLDTTALRAAYEARRAAKAKPQVA